MITIGVHLKSGSTWHFIEPKLEVKPQPSLPVPSGGLLTHIRFRRYLALTLLALSAFYSFASFGQTTFEQNQARNDPNAQGCMLVPRLQGLALAIAEADATNQDNPIRWHPALDATMSASVAQVCETIFQTSYPTLYAESETWKNLFLRPVQAQVTCPPTSPPLSPSPGPNSMALALDGSVHGNVGSAASLSVSLTTTKANDIIYVVGTTNLSTMGAIPVQDTAALTWTQRQTANGGGNFLYVFTAKSSGILTADSITFTPSGTTFITVDAFGISGENFASPFDSNVSLPGTSATNTVTISTSNANDLIISAATLGSASSITPPAGFTSISNANFQWVGYEIVSAIQSNLAITTTQGAASIADAVVAASGAAALFRRTLAQFGTGIGKRQPHAWN